MPVVLAALGDQIRTRRHGAIHRVVLRCLDLELGNCVGIRYRRGCVSAVDCVSAGRGIAVHEHALGTPPQGACVVDVGRRARGHRQHLSEVSGIQRYGGDRLLIDQRAGRRGGCGETAPARHGFVRVAGFQVGVKHRNFRNVHRQLRQQRGFEALCREPHFVGGGRQQRKAIRPVGVGDGGLRPVRGAIQQPDGRVRNRGAGGVLNGALQGAGVRRLTVQCSGATGDDERGEHTPQAR